MDRTGLLIPVIIKGKKIVTHLGKPWTKVMWNTQIQKNHGMLFTKEKEPRPKNTMLWHGICLSPLRLP